MRFEKLTVKAQEAVARAGGESEYDLFYEELRERTADHHEENDESGDAVDKSKALGAPSASEPNEIMVQLPDGNLSPMSHVSPTVAALAQSLRFERIHVSAEYRDVVMAAMKH